MSSIVEQRDLQDLQSAWRNVFRSTDPFTWPFHGRFQTGRLFCPTDGAHLTREQFSVICKASEDVGENRFFLSIVESEDHAFLSRAWGHWRCQSPRYEDYDQLSLTLENAIYSASGSWGVLISHEEHALISGTAEFLEALSHYYSAWNRDHDSLRELWNDNPNSTWVESLMPHVLM